MLTYVVDSLLTQKGINKDSKVCDLFFLRCIKLQFACMLIIIFNLIWEMGKKWGNYRHFSCKFTFLLSIPNFNLVFAQFQYQTAPVEDKYPD